MTGPILNILAGLFGVGVTKRGIDELSRGIDSGSSSESGDAKEEKED